MSEQGPYSAGGYIPMARPLSVQVDVGEVVIDEHGLVYVLTQDGWQLHGVVALDAVARGVTGEGQS